MQETEKKDRNFKERALRETRRQESILKILPGEVAVRIQREDLEFEKLQEIRMRVGKPLFLKYNGCERQLSKGGSYIVTEDDLTETLRYAGNYSLYAFEQEIGQGYLTVEGGHRIGVSGQVILDQGNIRNLKYVSSLHLRVAHEILGCADELLPVLFCRGHFCNTLLIGPPGCGKTTLLRDLIRQISEGGHGIPGMNVGVVDERSEIGGSYMGIQQNDLGSRTDLLDACPKAKGMMMLIRSMGPQVIAVDEVGSTEEIQALEYAMYCGCYMLATVHGASLEEIRRKPVFQQFFQRKLFQRYIVISSSSAGERSAVVFGEQGEVLNGKAWEGAGC